MNPDADELTSNFFMGCVAAQTKPAEEAIFDQNGSGSPTHGQQECSALNGYFGCTASHARLAKRPNGELETHHWNGSFSKGLLLALMGLKMEKAAGSADRRLGNLGWEMSGYDSFPSMTSLFFSLQQMRRPSYKKDKPLNLFSGTEKDLNQFPFGSKFNELFQSNRSLLRKLGGCVLVGAILSGNCAAGIVAKEGNRYRVSAACHLCRRGGGLPISGPNPCIQRCCAKSVRGRQAGEPSTYHLDSRHHGIRRLSLVTGVWAVGSQRGI